MEKLYDPRYNITREVTMSYLSELTGKSIATLFSLKSKGARIENINCYLLKKDTTVNQRREWYAKQTYHDERWKEVMGSDGKFLISNYGRFKRVHKTKQPTFLLPVQKKAGYLEIKVQFRGVYKAYTISRLVGYHFIGDPPSPNHVLRHKNGIRWDDYVNNLEYVTKSVCNKKIGGLARSRAIVQLDKDTGEVLGEYRSAKDVERKCFISSQSVLDCCNKKTKITAGMYIFQYLDEYEEELNNGKSTNR